jgi:hypothetical protein
MRKARIAAAAVVVAALVGSSAAMAGEITGNGTPLWTNSDQWQADHTLHGKSACAFSGQEDNQYGSVADNPLNYNPDYSATAGHSQSWGQGVRNTTPVGGFGGLNPGLFCNPTKG